MLTPKHVPPTRTLSSSNLRIEIYDLPEIGVVVIDILPPIRTYDTLKSFLFNVFCSIVAWWLTSRWQR